MILSYVIIQIVEGCLKIHVLKKFYIRNPIIPYLVVLAALLSLFVCLQVGGAFAPPLKDLCRFLKENSEYGVAPEWGDVVKQSVSILQMHHFRN